MRHILIVLLILLIPINLPGGTEAVIVKKEGLVLTINKGLKNGVKIGLTGIVKKKSQKLLIKIGKFEVIRIEQDISEVYVVKLNPMAKIETAVQVEFDGILPPPPTPGDILNCLKMKDYKRADQLIKDFLEIAPGHEEMKKLGRGVELLIKPFFSVSDYLSYRIIQPGSPILSNLKEKLYKNYPNLPSGYYLDLAMKIGKSSQGYYEIEFQNSHTMIYIPERKLFVDKYEVSNSQYLKFAGENNKKIMPIPFSTLKGYPQCCLYYPAIVSYEEAEAYCSANGLRLPTEEEWDIIAGKDKGYKYSWEYRANFESIGDGYIEVAPVRSFEDSPSPLGAVNIMGNVYEWVKGKICKGGGYMTEKRKQNFELKSRNCIRVGFRCVMDEIKQ